MKVQLTDGRVVSFPEGTDPATALSFIEKNYPEAPNVAERALGHLSTGAGEFIQKVSNLTGYTPFGNEATMQGFQNMKELFTENQFARATAAHPETTMLGQILGGITEFIPQIPAYAAGEGAALGVMSKLPMLSKIPAALKAIPGEGIVTNTAKAVGRAGIAGATVGTIAGTPAESAISEKLLTGGEEALGFAGATAVLHPAFRGLGLVGRAVIRKLRGKATFENVKAELEKRAKDNPAAAEDLAKLEEGAQEELYVPRPKEAEAEIEAGELIKPKVVQGELNLDPLPAETEAKFKELGYDPADLEGLPDKQLITILENQIKKPPDAPPPKEGRAAKSIEVPSDAVFIGRDTDGNYNYQNKKGEVWTVADPPIGREGEKAVDIMHTDAFKKKEVASDSTNQEGLQGRKRRRKGAKQGEPEQGAGGEAVAASGDVQALEGEGAPKAEGTAAAPSGKKITIAREDILTLQRMGYSAAEIKAMKPEDATATIDAVKNLPEPPAEELAKATEAAAKINEAALAREQAKATAAERPPLTEEQKLKIAEDLEAELAADTEPLTKTAEAIIKAQELEDPTLDTLLDGAARLPEDVRLRLQNRDRIAERVAALKKGKVEEAPAAVEQPAVAKTPPQTREELMAYLKSKKGANRRARKSDAELEAEANKILGEEEHEPGDIEHVPEGDGYTLDSMGGQQIYERGKAFFSKLSRAVESKPFTRMPADQLKSMLKGMQVSEREIENILGGLKGVVTKQDVLEEIKANTIELKDVVLGADYKKAMEEAKSQGLEVWQLIPLEGKPTQFSQYQEPGAVPGSYREMFVTAPSKNPEIFSGQRIADWNDGHSAYDGVENPIVRIRFNERDVSGKKILFVEEIQGPSGDTKYTVNPSIKTVNDVEYLRIQPNTLNQESPKYWFKNKLTGKEFPAWGKTKEEATQNAVKWLNAPINKVIEDLKFNSKKEAEAYAAQHKIDPSQIEKVVEGNQGKMPPELQARIYDIGVKRILAYAKENGYDGVAWTTGEMQRQRYKEAVVKEIESVTWYPIPTSGGGKEVTLFGTNKHKYHFGINKDGTILQAPEGFGTAQGRNIEELVGKELGPRILKEIGGDEKTANLSFGGEGLKDVYDSRLPAMFKKYGKGEVGEIKIGGKKEVSIDELDYANRRDGLPDHQPGDTYLLDETKSVPYTSISPKTPPEFPLYSGPEAAIYDWLSKLAKSTKT
ncbi:MAG: hypothetical protein WC208_16955, partial [Gallionella sp.]